MSKVFPACVYTVIYSVNMDGQHDQDADKIMLTRANVALTFVSINSTERRAGNP